MSAGQVPVAPAQVPNSVAQSVRRVAVECAYCKVSTPTPVGALAFVCRQCGAQAVFIGCRRCGTLITAYLDGKHYKVRCHDCGATNNFKDAARQVLPKVVDQSRGGGAVFGVGVGFDLD